MNAFAVKSSEPSEEQSTILWLGKEVANTANLYFAPVTSVVRTIHDVWTASGFVGPIWWGKVPTNGPFFNTAAKNGRSNSTSD
jgi:hypothetical protein